MKIIGVTGNTGSGKGYVCKILEEAGALVIDADKIAHATILNKNPAYNEIVDYFGTAILDSADEIDRKKLGAIVFNDKEKLNYLSKIVHRYVIEETERIITCVRDSRDLLVIDAPLLIEAKMDRICDEVWLIYAEDSIRLKRIMERDMLSEEEALLRMRSQTPFENLKPYATKIIKNESSYEAVLEQVEHVLRS